MSSFFEISYCDQIKHVDVVDKIPQSGGTLPSTITFDGVGCKYYTFSANCDWDMTSTSPNITVTPSTGAANVLYDITVCYVGEPKVAVIDNSGNTYTIQCDDTGVLNWRQYEYQKTGISNEQNIAEVVIGDCVEELGNYCFYNTTITSVTLPDSLKIIGQTALGYNVNLTGITIPSSVTTINSYAFYNCTGLQSVTVLAVAPPSMMGSFAFNNTNNCPIYVPSASVNAYKTATNWSTYADRITAIPNS